MSGIVILIFSKSAVDSIDQASATAPVPADTPTVREETTPEENTPAAKTEIPTAPEIDLQPDEGLVPVKSPLLGIFYHAPKPGAPPFVEEGAVVSEDDTVCLVEVMKCFNTVKADVKGRVAKILAENNQMVEYNQTLFLIDPETSSEESSST